VPNGKLTTFDTYTHGFDLPASIQLSRVNRKLERWERAREIIDQNQAERELFAKNVMKHEEKLEKRIEKTKAQEAKQFRTKVEEREAKRAEKAQKQVTAERSRAGEVAELVKEYYKDIKAHHQTKEERRKEIEAKLRATYDAYQGSKAVEFERRLQAALDDIEQGQELNAEIHTKLEQRKEAAAAMVKRKGEDVQEAN